MPIDPIIPSSQRSTYEKFHFAPGVHSGEMLYVSGVVAALKKGQSGTAEEYATAARSAFKQIEEVLVEAGGTMADIVSITSFHIGMHDHLGPLAAVKDELIPEPYPAWTAIGVSELLLPLGFVEIQVIARIA